MSSLTFRGASATLARESDILVFISKSRYWHTTNLLLFMFGTIVSLVATLKAASSYVFNGDYCLAEATGGSLSFLTWWFEWALDDYPIGAGMIHAEGESIKNPWSLKAAELGLARPLKPSRSQIAGMWEASEMASHLQSQDKETFEMYKEFMHDHFDLQGLDCVGNDQNHGLIFLILLVGTPLWFWLMMRNARDYWLKRKSCCGGDDPYDMSVVYKDFQARAKVGARLAARDKNNDGFIDAATELSDDSDDEDGGQELAPQLQMGGENSTTAPRPVYSSQMVFTKPPIRYTDLGLTVVESAPPPQRVHKVGEIGMRTCTRARARARSHTHTHTCKHTHANTRMQTHEHACAHAHTHTHTHILSLSHTQALNLSLFVCLFLSLQYNMQTHTLSLSGI